MLNVLVMLNLFKIYKIKLIKSKFNNKLSLFMFLN